LSPPDGGDLPDLAEAIRAAQEEMARAIQLGGLTNDPIRYTFAAMSAHLGASLRIAEDIRASAGIGARGLTPEGEDALLDRMSRAVASGADERAATLARAHNWRTVFLVMATVVGLTAVALASGYWTGLNAGRAEQAARTTAAADIRTYLGDDLMGARQWRDLIRLNGPGIKQALAQCVPNAQPNGQPACSVLLWTGPAPGAKN